jgi:hypothetical protein
MRLSAWFELLNQPNEVLERTILTAVEEFPDSVAAVKLGQFSNPEKAVGIASVISTARTQMGFLDNKNLRDNMEFSDFSFDEMREGGRRTTVYLVLPPHLLSAYARWLRLMVSVAIGTLQKGPLDESEREGLAIDNDLKGPDRRQPESAEVRAFDKKQFDAMVKDAFSMERLAQLGGGKDAPRNIPIPPPGPMGKYRVEPLKKLPPELREPTMFQMVMNYLRERKERKEKEKLAERERLLKHFQNQMKAMPYTVGGITIDPNLPLPSKEEMEAELARWKAEKAAATAALARGEGLPVLFLLDEFGTIGRLGAISTGFGLAAGTGPGISIWAFVQDLNQLKRYYPDEFETFLGNVSSFISFGIMDGFTLGYVSKQLGMKTIRYYTTGKTVGTNKRIRPQTMEDVIGRIFGDKPTLEEDSGSSESSNTTEHVVAQPLASPDEIRKMNPQKCIVIGHDDPILCRRVDYYSDPTFSAWARPDPKYAKR